MTFQWSPIGHLVGEIESMSVSNAAVASLLCDGMLMGRQVASQGLLATLQRKLQQDCEIVAGSSVIIHITDSSCSK